MNKILELREKRAKSWEAAKAFLDTKRGTDGIVSAEDTATYEKMEADVVALGKEIDRLEKQEALDRELSKPLNTPLTGKPIFQGMESKGGRASAEYQKAFWNAMRTRSGEGLDPVIKNALQIGTDTEGGYLVPDEFERTLIEALDEENIFRKLLKRRLYTETPEQSIAIGSAVALTDALSHEWTDLPKTDINGTPYVYSVDETMVPTGYQKTLGEVSYNYLGEGRQTITNTMEWLNLNFTKKWVNGPEIKPEVSIGVRVNGNQITDINGQVVSDIILRNGETGGVFSNLPYYDSDGNEISYTIVETRIGNENVVEGKAGNYTVDIDGTKITNTYVPEKTTINVEKVWKGGNEESRVPVTIQLFREAAGENIEFVGQSVTLDETNNWNYQWTDLDTETKTATAYTYSVEELNVPESYNAQITGSGTEDDPFVVTNTYLSSLTDITAYKKWIGGPIEKPNVEITLYRKTEAMDTAEIVPTGLQNPIIIESGDLSYTWENLPVNDAEGNLYKYTAVETKIGEEEVVDNKASDYRVSYDGMVITNTYETENITINAEKVWQGGDEADHTAPEFILLQNGRELVGTTPMITPAESTSDRFAYEWTVPKTDAYGQDYQYAVDESGVPEGYGKSITQDETGKWIITNTFQSHVTDISVHKDWFGGSDYPDITFELQRRTGTGEFATVATEILPTGDHIHIWKNQPLADENNVPYEYRVIETKIGDTEVVESKALNYNVSYSGNVDEGFTVTNTFENALEIPVTKVWVDNNNAQSTRPDTITLTAVREDGVEKTQIFNVTEDNIYTIIGLEKYKPNSTEEYIYNIVEAPVQGYRTTVEGTTITNTLSGITQVDFTKVWDGGPEIKPNITV